jgi:tetratricopeptide (TPR) repeat protein
MSCRFADLKTQLARSRLFKLEAERAIALDPHQDIAYYLLGRWNLEIASVGFLSRTYVKLVYGELPRASYGDAIADFRKAVALAPNRIIHHGGLAEAYESAGDKALALAELRQCVTMKPAGPEDEEARGDALKRLSRLGQRQAPKTVF